MDASNNLAEVVQKIVDLAGDAKGSVDVVTVPGAPGLPAAVLVGVRKGAKPEFFSVKPLVEEWRVAPERRKGVATADTLASFIDLANRHKDADSAIFAASAMPSPRLTAVIDYHKADGEPRFGQHRVTYAFPLTEEFKLWVAANGKELGQAEFAEFIERNIADLSAPMDAETAQFEPLFRAKFAVPTDLVELARGLSVRVASKVKNQIRLASGEMSLQYETTHENERGEPLIVPGLFMLCLPPFVDGSLVRIVARLRYRVREGQVMWSYQLYNWQELLRARVKSDLAIAAQQTGLPTFEGAPEA